MLVLDGKAVAAALSLKLKDKIQRLEKKLQRAPHLVVVLVGDDPASAVYVKNKHLACEKVGLKSSIEKLSAKTTEQQLIQKISELNHRSDVDAILVQLPLPAHLDSQKIIESINPDKDADILTSANLGALWAGRSALAPCTPQGVIKILEHYQIQIAGLHAVVIGRSQIVGKPMAHLLTQKDATVTVCHSKTPDLTVYTKAADLVVVAAGKPEFIGQEAFASHAIVVDVGIHRKKTGGLCGDVKFEEVQGRVRALTPVPGGVGPMTIACLLENTVALAERRLV